MNLQSKIIETVEQTPNNSELGGKIRKMLQHLIFKKDKILHAPNQISIFDEIKERENDRSK